MSKVYRQFIELQELVDEIIDNRGKTVPTTNSGIPLIATNCIKLSSIYPTFENIRYVSEDVHNTWFRAHLKPNDILFVNKGTPGRVCVVPDPINFCAAQDMVGLRFKNSVDYRYMLAVLRSEEIQKTVANNHVGLVIPHFRKQELVKLKLPIVSVALQKQIGKFYFDISNKIELNNKINSELEAMAKTLYDYWFVQFDFPDENGKPYKSSGGKIVWDERLKRAIPDGWEAKSVGEILNKNPQTNRIEAKEYLPNGNHPVIDQSTDFIAGFTNDDTSMIKGSESPQIVFGDHTRILKFINFDFARGADGTQILNSKLTNLPQHLFYFSLRKIDLSNYGYARHFKFLKEQLIIVPKLEVAIMFERTGQLLFNLVLNNQKQNQELANLRNWLLPMLMNGQISVGKAYGQVEEALDMAAEPRLSYATVVKLDISKKETGFAKQVLAGKIVSLFKEDKHFGHIKLQKLQFLAEHIIEADLNLNYYFQRAGPYDNRFMHTIADSFRRSKWFDEQRYKYFPLEKHLQIEGYYQGYFAPVSMQLDRLFGLLANATEVETEIIATVYAVWNNRIILRQPITESLLIQDFYNWSERKRQYSEKQVLDALVWLKENDFEPRGFGKEIKKAKGSA